MNIAYLIVAFFFVYCRFGVSFEKLIENINLPPHNGIVFQEMGEVRQTENYWNIEIPVDMSQFENNIREVLRILNKIYLTCHSLHHSKSLNCYENVNFARVKAQKQLNEIALLRGNKIDFKSNLGKNIIKRDLHHPILPLGGDLLYWLFGTARFKDMERFNQHLDKLYSTTNSLVDFSKKQTKFLTNLVNNFTQVKQFTKRMHERLENLNNEYNLVYLQDHELQIMRDITENFENKIIAIKTALMQHRFTSELVKPDIFLSQLREINDHLPAGKVLPFVYTLEYYVNIPVQTNIVGHLLILTLRVPIVNDEAGKLLEIHALPFQIQNNSVLAYIESNFQYILVFKEYYVYLKSLTSCIKLEHSYVCRSIEPFRKTDFSGDCIFDIYKNQTFNLDNCKHHLHLAHLKNSTLLRWGKNSWFYSFGKNTTEKLSAACGETLEVLNLIGTGIVHISEGCNVEVKNLMFKTEKETGNSLINVTENLDLHDKLLNFLEKNLSNIKKHETNLLDVSFNDGDLKKIAHSVNTLEYRNELFIPNPLKEILPSNSWVYTTIWNICSFIAVLSFIYSLAKWIFKNVLKIKYNEPKIKRSVTFKTGLDEVVFDSLSGESLI